MNDENQDEMLARLFAGLLGALRQEQAGSRGALGTPLAGGAGAPEQGIYPEAVLPGVDAGPHWMEIVSGHLPRPMKPLRAGNYPTNDLVYLQCDLRGGVNGTLYVNGLEPIDLRPKQIVVLLLLVQCMPEYMSAEDIAQLVTTERDRLLLKEGCCPLEQWWRYPVAEDVRRAVCQVRTALKRRKGNQNLIESGPRGLGYRIGTPTHCVFVALRGASPRPEGSQHAR